MAKYYQVGNQRLDASQIPYQEGTDEYYRFLSQWRNKALGDSYQRSREFLDVEARLNAAKARAGGKREGDYAPRAPSATGVTEAQLAEARAELARVQGMSQAEKASYGGGWEKLVREAREKVEGLVVQGRGNQGERWEDLEKAYNDALGLETERERAWQTERESSARGLDRGGQGRAAKGYAQVTNPQTGAPEWAWVGDEYDNGDDLATNDYNGTLGATAAALAPTPGTGKRGGAGNQATGESVDNSWNEADGVDVRTEEQKFYDRNVSNVSQQADAEGRYSWFGEEEYQDAVSGEKKRRKLNLSELAGGGGTSPYRKDAIWNYNGGAGNSAAYDDAIRRRENKSIYSRTA